MVRVLEGFIVPIVKKGKDEDVKEYRGVILMQTLYRIYATMLSKRLEEEMERKGILSYIIESDRV